jgi:hypothetical protein
MSEDTRAYLVWAVIIVITIIMLFLLMRPVGVF